MLVRKHIMDFKTNMKDARFVFMTFLEFKCKLKYLFNILLSTVFLCLPTQTKTFNAFLQDPFFQNILFQRIKLKENSTKLDTKKKKNTIYYCFFVIRLFIKRETPDSYLNILRISCTIVTTVINKSFHTFLLIHLKILQIKLKKTVINLQIM